MGKLPATSYVRLVDIWLIFVQLYPFIEVVLFTIIEMHIEEEITNNHGRLKRFVPEAKKEVCTFSKIMCTYTYVFNTILVLQYPRKKRGSWENG